VWLRSADVTEPRHARKGWWPSRWVRDETFWRDVATRTLAGLIVAAFVAVGAAGGGFIPWRGVALAALAVALMLSNVLWFGKVGHRYGPVGFLVWLVGFSGLGYFFLWAIMRLVPA
jgi:hypothetical protein